MNIKLTSKKEILINENLKIDFDIYITKFLSKKPNKKTEQSNFKLERN